jgi:GNAT superfamily N-acetyltransferase
MLDFARHHTVIAAPPGALAWIAGSFEGQIARIPCGPRNTHEQADALIRMIRLGKAQAMVATPRGYPDDWSGWAVGAGGALLFAYVRAPLRRHGIGLELIGAVTPESANSVHVAYWTNDVDGMSRHGIPLLYDIRAYQALLDHVRGPARKRTRAAKAA